MALLDMNYTVLTFFFFFFLFLSKQTNASISTDGIYDCQIGTFDATQKYKLSTAALLSDLVSRSLSKTFYSSSSSASGLNTTTYGLFYCTANVNSQACQTCVQKAVADVQLHCSSYKAAIVYHTDCTLRYNTTAVYATPVEYFVGWLYSTGIFNTVTYPGFNRTLYDTMNKLITDAAYGSGSKGFAIGDAGLVGTSERLYGLVQCTPDILGGPCKACLDRALQEMPLCCVREIGGPERTVIMTFLPSCQLRYEVKYPGTGTGTSGGTPSYSPGKVVWYTVLVLAVAAFGLL